MKTVGKESLAGGFLVYFNGVRVPALSASVSIQKGTPASCTIQVPAHSILLGLGDEDLIDVAVFYLDTIYNENPTWCLLYEGRVTGQGYSNDPLSETMYFTVESYLNSLADLYLNFMPKGEGTAESSRSYPNQINLRGKRASRFLSRSLSGRKLSRPFDLIDNIYYSVLGSTVAKVSSSIARSANKSVSSLIARKEEALASKFEAKAKRVLQSEGIRPTDEGYASRLAEEAANQQIQYVKENNGDLYNSSLDAEIRNALRSEVRSAAMKGSPTVLTGFFARYFRRIRSRNHWMCSPYIEGVPNSSNPLDALKGGGVFPIFRSSKGNKYAKSFAKQSGAKNGPGGSAYSLVNNIFSLYFYSMSEILAPPAHTSDKYGLPKGMFLTEDRDPSEKDPKFYTEWAEKLSRSDDRLCIGSFLTHPDMMFCVPPMCNAIFPSMRTSFSLNNNYKGKPTRLYYDKKSPYGRLDFSTNSAGYSAESSRVTFPSFLGGAAQKEAGRKSGIDMLVFPEEYYRGPNPVAGQVHPTYMDIKKYASASRFGSLDRGDSVASIPSIEGMTPEEAISALESVEKAHRDKISSYGLYYLLARKDFLTRRYASVSGSLNMVFNPYLICGFPCAVLGGEDSGLHFYGEIQSIQHSLTQSSMSTSIQVGAMRSLQDVIKGISADKFDLDVYPQEPLEEVRDLLQVYESANEYYSQVLKKEEIDDVRADQLSLLQSLRSKQEELSDIKELIKDRTLKEATGDYDYTEDQKAEDADTQAFLEFEINTMNSSVSYPNPRSASDGFPAAFDFKSFLGWEEDNGVRSRIILNEYDKERFPRWYGTPTGYRDNKIVPLRDTQDYFNSSSKALKLASRPVCTLEQYIDFYYCVDIDKKISEEEGRGRGCRVGKRTDHFSGAVYYDVIRQYIGGPGIQPGLSPVARSQYFKSKLNRYGGSLPEFTRDTLKAKIEDMSNVALSLSGVGPEGPKVFRTVAANDTVSNADLPDSRRDWQNLLLDYLTIIEGKEPLKSEG